MIADAVHRTRLRSHADRKLLIIMMGCSLILHGGVVLIATAGLGFSFKKSRFAPVYAVELVSLPAGSAKKYPSFTKARRAKTKARTRAIRIQRFRAKEQPPSLKRLERETVSEKEEEEIEPTEKTLTKIERPAPPSPPVQEKAKEVTPRPGTDQKLVSLENIGGIKGGELSQALMLYRAMVNERIETNWVYPERLDTEKGELVAIVVVRARRDGTLTDIKFEKKSGNPYFDDSVLKAILKSKPFPPFPDIYSPKEEEIVIRFSPAAVSS